MREAIGGYFELELPQGGGNNPHGNKAAVNTGRNALYCILSSLEPSRIYLPRLLCDVLLEPIGALGIPHEFYSLDSSFSPEPISPDPGEYILYINYFGVCDRKVEDLSRRYPGSLIVDSTQAFFSRALPGIPTFYSARKFFGVPDGAYFCGLDFDEATLPVDSSYDRCRHLLKRLDCSPEQGYRDFMEADELFSSVPPSRMSRLTGKLLSSIDFNSTESARTENYRYLHGMFGSVNQLAGTIPESCPAISYPLMVDSADEVRQKLIDSRVFVPVFWPTARKFCSGGSAESIFIENVVHIPVDQRYSERELSVIPELTGLLP